MSNPHSQAFFKIAWEWDINDIASSQVKLGVFQNLTDGGCLYVPVELSSESFSHRPSHTGLTDSGGTHETEDRTCVSNEEEE